MPSATEEQDAVRVPWEDHPLKRDHRHAALIPSRETGERVVHEYHEQGGLVAALPTLVRRRWWMGPFQPDPSVPRTATNGLAAAFLPAGCWPKDSPL